MSDVSPALETRPITEEADFLQIKNIDHIHFWVGNAKQAMYFWWKGLGFKPVAYSGLETGNRSSASYVLDTFHPLQIAVQALELEKLDYMASWLEGEGE